MFKTISNLNPPKISFKHKRRTNNEYLKQVCDDKNFDYCQEHDISVFGKTCRLKDTRNKANKVCIIIF